MSVIDKIERGYYILVIPAWGNTQKTREATKELLLLAKLGEAAEKTIVNTKRFFTSPICRNLPPTIDDEYCEGCEWQNFCRLRKESEGRKG